MAALILDEKLLLSFESYFWVVQNASVLQSKAVRASVSVIYSIFTSRLFLNPGQLRDGDLDGAAGQDGSAQAASSGEIPRNLKKLG